MTDRPGWRVLAQVEGPDASGPDVLDEVRRTHPEVGQLDDERFGIDIVCGRDGIVRRRVLVRTTPPPKKPPRYLP